jgi:hypothetical protein
MFPEDLSYEFLTISLLKISTIRFDGAIEFGKNSSFIAYYTHHDVVRDPLTSYTHIQNARAEGAIRIFKEHVRCLLHSVNLSHRFCPDVLSHFCLLYVYWLSGTSGLESNPANREITSSSGASVCQDIFSPDFFSIFF